MLRIASIFNNGMILQRNSVIRIWGESDAECIEAVFDGNTYSADCCDGKWTVDIRTEMSYKPLILTVISKSGKDGEILQKIEISDVLLGDVWLAGGQSNMELELINSLDGMDAVKRSDYEDIRFYNVPKCSGMNEAVKCESDTSWKSAVGKNSSDMSAIAYYFAVKLHEELHVPIGIIGCYLGGTSATCWVSEDALKEVDEISEYLNEWKIACEDKTDEQYSAELDAYNRKCNEWVELVDKLKSESPDITWTEISNIAGNCPWPGPKGRTSPYRPFGLHEFMIKRISPYGIKGIIYYQGEEDTKRADCYCKLNSAVINQWRSDFYIEGNDKNIPFIITQLPMYIEAGMTNDESWCIVRRQQEMCCEINENVSMAVLIDCGERYNVHPLNKKIPGERLAFSALKNVYGNSSFPENMKVSDVTFKDNRCELSFTNTYGGICLRKTDGSYLTGDITETVSVYDSGSNNDNEYGCNGINCDIYGFEITGDSINYYMPDISVHKGKIILTGRENEPVTGVRYGWWNYGVANIYNGMGMPLIPFNITG